MWCKLAEFGVSRWPALAGDCIRFRVRAPRSVSLTKAKPVFILSVIFVQLVDVGFIPVASNAASVPEQKCKCMSQ